MTDDPIAEMLLRCAAQDRAAFRAIYSATSSKLFGLLIRILGDRAEAEDALQEVFTRVWLKAARYDGARGTGMAWLVALARNHAIDRLRARPQTTAEMPEDIADDRMRPETRLIATGELARMSTCFDQLEPDRASAVRGAYLQGLSYTDLAARFDVPLNTMRTWLRRSLLSLRDCLNQ
ncbi:sigma-70 family RNA polymerase sigma factor [Fuscibacter oryzae]|uniref:Sigma-70 family RNA polymerase sigma factor n=1 Tax=Fuscibacter oryzae TaxID=2803939 RepID=A0A8J7MQ55_9RHOB|nr:sigma-70 family RNA polymerase sigma factor [Fuscibacter oryzae]MBL4928023.1 sigma-70 family RNA polymerase sigma factor [Fuscibacter oryzae]